LLLRKVGLGLLHHWRGTRKVIAHRLCSSRWWLARRRLSQVSRGLLCNRSRDWDLVVGKGLWWVVAVMWGSVGLIRGRGIGKVWML